MMLSNLCRQLTSACSLQRNVVKKNGTKKINLHRQRQQQQMQPQQQQHHQYIVGTITGASAGFSSSFPSAAAAAATASFSTLSSSSSFEKTEPEIVQVLKLNMLQDNPGAVKKVRYL